MSHDQIAHLYRNRHRLGRAELDWATRRAAVIDAHHVAKVHQRYGIVDGFEITASEDMLEVGPGSAYTPCGDLIVMSCPVRLGPPTASGTHDIVLGTAGHVTVIPHGSRRPPDSLHLGRIFVPLASPPPDDAFTWMPLTLRTDGRHTATAHRRANVASGVEHLGAADLNVIADQATGARRVNTNSAGFSVTPLYFVSVQFTSIPPERTPIGLIMTDICDAEPTAFTLKIRVLLLSVPNPLPVAASSVPTPPGLVIRWLGVVPDRPGPHHLDPSCGKSSPNIT